MSRHYEVVFQGTASPGVRSAFSDLTVSSRRSETALTGASLDEAALIAIIERVQALGLTILDIHPIESSKGDLARRREQP